VARFVGADRGLKRLALRRLDEIELEPLDGRPPPAGPQAPGSTTLRDALSLMMSEGADPLVVVNADGTPIGLLSVARVGRVLSEL
jgi:osmoprotectant transport system ATP-binding protein